MNNVERLQHWFAMHSDDAQNDYQVNITTTDNPGWWVRINFQKYAPLAKATFKNVREGVVVGKDKKSLSEEFGGEYSFTKLKDGSLYATRNGDWIDCRVMEGHFDGAGDVHKLDQILQIFLDWAESLEK
jgi:hypothetical protein